MPKQPEWHEQITAILERRARLVGEVRRSRTLSAETRKLALRAVEDECFAAAQRVFPRPAAITHVQQLPQSITASTAARGIWTGNA
jgi:hypothetical protein